jgi:hypothetical protein
MSEPAGPAPDRDALAPLMQALPGETDDSARASLAEAVIYVAPHLDAAAARTIDGAARWFREHEPVPSQP